MKLIPYKKIGDMEKDFYLGGPHRVLLSLFMTTAITASSFDHFLWEGEAPWGWLEQFSKRGSATRLQKSCQVPTCTTDATGTLGKGLPGRQDLISGAAHSALRKLQSWLSSSTQGFCVEAEPGLPKFLLTSSFHKHLLSTEHLLYARHCASSLLKADKSPCLTELTFPSGENKQVDK